MRNSDSESLSIRDSAMIVFKGLLIGIANIIPGVSGGTFALILGIYERILDALHSIDINALGVVFRLFSTGFSKKAREDFNTLLRKIDALFLICLGSGAVIAILALSFLIDWLLTVHPALTLSFFIGLIIPSIAVPWRMMTDRKWVSLLWILPGAALTVIVAMAFGHIQQAGDNLLWCFTTGVIAISAMILPGISGSFVMLVMGQYQNILKKIQLIQTSIASGQFAVGAFVWLSVFGIGCIVGLLLFARLLGFLLRKYRTPTLAFLIGLIIGSFWILWPFKNYDYHPDLSHISAEYQARVAKKQDIRVATAPNTWPDDLSEVLLNLVSFGMGFVGALGMNRLGGEENKIT